MSKEQASSHWLIDAILAAMPELTPYLDINPSTSEMKAGEMHVYLYRQKAFTIYEGKKAQHITFLDVRLDDALQTISSQVSALPQDAGYRVYIGLDFNQDAFIAYIKALAADKRSTVTVERFGCCHNFIKCSDACACLFPGDYFHLGCYYRDNLEKGLIFYGKNRNTDHK